jgi:hypothetical protein
MTQAQDLPNDPEFRVTLIFILENLAKQFHGSAGAIYLVIEGYKNNEFLDENLQQDIKTCIGLPQSQEELQETTGING